MSLDLFNWKKLLVISPHPDDEILWCWWTLLKNKDLFDETFCLYLNYWEQSNALKNIILDSDKIKIRFNEIVNIKRLLWFNKIEMIYEWNKKIWNSKIIKKFQEIVNEYEPDVLMIPWFWDEHVDHKIISYYLSEWIIKHKILKECIVFAYEIWSPLINPNYFEDISDFVDKKTDLIWVYESVTKYVDYWKCVKWLNSYRSIHNWWKWYFEAYLKMSLRDYLYLYYTNGKFE